MIASRVLRVAGMGESAVAERLADLFAVVDEPDDRLPGVDGRGEGAAHGEGAVARRPPRPWRSPSSPRCAPGSATSCSAPTTSRSRRRCSGCCARAGRTLACAESLTGGGVGARLTSRARGVGVVRRVGGRVHGRGEASGARRARRRPGGRHGDRGVRPGDGDGRAAGVRRGPRGGADRRRRARAARRRRAGHDLGRDRRRRRLHARARASSSRGERDRVRRWAEQAGLDLVRRHLEGVSLPGTSLPVGRERPADAFACSPRSSSPTRRAPRSRPRRNTLRATLLPASAGRRPENLHLTLVFLGWVDADQVGSDPRGARGRRRARRALPRRARRRSDASPIAARRASCGSGSRPAPAELDGLAGRVRRARRPPGRRGPALPPARHRRARAAARPVPRRGARRDAARRRGRRSTR